MEEERDIFAIAILRLKEMRMKREFGLIIEGGRAVRVPRGGNEKEKQDGDPD